MTTHVSKPAEGDIFTAYESVHTPARIALKLDIGFSAPVRGIGGGKKLKQRPCLIMARRDGEPMRVCVMATFGGKSRDGLADFFQKFLVPVHPYFPDHSKKEYTLRTTVTWNASGWIVAYPFTPLGSMVKPYTLRTRAVRVTHGELVSFQFEIERKQEEWRNMMARDTRGLQQNYREKNRENYEGEANQGAQLPPTANVDLAEGILPSFSEISAAPSAPPPPPITSAATRSTPQEDSPADAAPTLQATSPPSSSTQPLVCQAPPTGQAVSGLSSGLRAVTTGPRQPTDGVTETPNAAASDPPTAVAEPPPALVSATKPPPMDCASVVSLGSSSSGPKALQTAKQSRPLSYASAASLVPPLPSTKAAPRETSATLAPHSGTRPTNAPAPLPPQASPSGTTRPAPALFLSPNPDSRTTGRSGVRARFGRAVNRIRGRF